MSQEPTWANDPHLFVAGDTPNECAECHLDIRAAIHVRWSTRTSPDPSDAAVPEWRLRYDIRRRLVDEYGETVVTEFEFAFGMSLPSTPVRPDLTARIESLPFIDVSGARVVALDAVLAAIGATPVRPDLREALANAIDSGWSKTGTLADLVDHILGDPSFRAAIEGRAEQVEPNWHQIADEIEMAGHTALALPQTEGATWFHEEVDRIRLAGVGQ